MRTLIVGFAWTSPLILVLLWPHAPAAGITIMVVSHALLLYATLRPNVQWLGPVVTHFETTEREVWLTIDDGPAADTTAILELLAARGVRATFFVKGALAQQEPGLVAAIRREGHGVENHSHTHPSAFFWCLPPADLGAEIDRCSEVIGKSRRFRAPVGMKNPAVHPILAARGMRLIGWSVRGFDTLTIDPGRVASRIVPRVVPGGIVVMHQGRTQSVQCIGRVVDELLRSGYSFVVPEDERLKTKR